jgi:glycosyltransferase involved in cell wall biosynthesis
MIAPTVSIGMPVYNGEAFLRQALDSLLSQDFTDLELIISDNASTDGTAAICQEYIQRDKRIHYYRNETNIGAAPNYNRVFHLASGKYFRWAAHDDVCYPAMIRRCVEALESAPSSVSLVYPRSENIDASGRVIKSQPYTLDTRYDRPFRRLAFVLRHVTFATPLFGLFRPETLRKTRLEDSFASSDYVLLAELAMLGQIWEVPELLFQRRIHNGISVRANPTWEKLTAWNDPTKADTRRYLPVQEMLMLEYLRSAWRLPLSRSDRFLCLLVIPVVTYWRRLRNAAGRHKREMRKWLPFARLEDKRSASYAEKLQE